MRAIILALLLAVRVAARGEENASSAPSPTDEALAAVAKDFARTECPKAYERQVTRQGVFKSVNAALLRTRGTTISGEQRSAIQRSLVDQTAVIAECKLLANNVAKKCRRLIKAGTFKDAATCVERSMRRPVESSVLVYCSNHASETSVRGLCRDAASRPLSETESGSSAD